jgi:hypothetical protein
MSEIIRSLSYVSIVLAAITLFVVPCASAGHLGDELISNSGFGEWDNGNPLNWTTPHSDWDVVKVNEPDGDYSLVLKTDRYTHPSTAKMISEQVDVEEDDRILVTSRVSSINSIDTRVRFRGYDSERERWITLKTFNPSSDLQHAFITIEEDVTRVRMRLVAGYVDDEDKGVAKSSFDDLAIIDPAVENADTYMEEGVIRINESLDTGSYELNLVDARDNKALINIVASGKVMDSGVLVPGEVAQFKKEGDTYLTFSVEEVFVNGNDSEVRIDDLLAGRIVTETPTIQPVEEEGLVFYLPLDENKGMDVHDYSANALHGAMHGARWTAGMEDFALELDGADDYADIPQTSDKFEAGDHTFSLWTKSTGVRDGSKYIFCHYNWRFHWGSDSEITFTVGRMNDGSGPAYNVRADVTGHESDWIHLAGVYKPSANKILFYVNGEYVGEKDIGEDRIWEDYGNHDLLIGTSKHGVATFYEGLVDEVRIYDRALSQQEIGEIMSSPLGLSGVSAYHDSLSLTDGEVVSVGNGFSLEYTAAPQPNLALIEGDTQTNMYSLENKSADHNMLLKDSRGIPVLRLNVADLSAEGLLLSDVWVSNEMADAPVLVIESLNFSSIRAYENSSVTVKIVNSGSKPYRAGGKDSVELYLEDELMGIREISNNLAAGESMECNFELYSQKAGANRLNASISTEYAENSFERVVDIAPPINPPVSKMPMYAEETDSGINLYLSLQGPGINGESWDDDAYVSVGIDDPMASKTFYENSHSVSGTDATITIPYEEFYEGDEQYVINVKFRDAENSVVKEVCGKDGGYNPPNNTILVAVLFVLLLGYVVRKKFL